MRTIAELEEEIRLAEEGIEQMRDAWEEGEYEGDELKYNSDVAGNVEFILRYQKQINRIRGKLL